MNARIALLFALVSTEASAQATISGIVRDSSRRPLADAEVIVMSPERHVRTDSAGKYFIAGLRAGTYELRARRLGFFIASAKVVLTEGTNKQLVFELERRPVLLDTVTVTESCGRFEFSSFVCRRRHGSSGEFLDVDAIDSANARFIADLFRRPGFRVEAATGRAGGLKIVPLTGWRCMSTIVNGKPASPSNPPPQTPQDLLGVEIYADQANVPSEYNNYAWGTIKAGRKMIPARCTLVVFWTSVRPRKR